MKEGNLDRLEEIIKEFIKENNGVSPTLGEICQRSGMVKSTVYRHLLELERRGRVSYSGRRSLEISGQREMRVHFCRVPVIGEIVCGTPENEEEEILGYLAVPEEWVDGDCFLLRARGDSMTDVGVCSGDLVLVRRSATAESGQVVVALTEEGNTLKRIFFENGKPRLRAENSSYPPEKRDIYPEKLILQGIALKVIKDII